MKKNDNEVKKWRTATIKSENVDDYSTIRVCAYGDKSYIENIVYVKGYGNRRVVYTTYTPEEMAPFLNSPLVTAIILDESLNEFTMPSEALANMFNDYARKTKQPVTFLFKLLRNKGNAGMKKSVSFFRDKAIDSKKHNKIKSSSYYMSTIKFEDETSFELISEGNDTYDVSFKAINYYMAAHKITEEHMNNILVDCYSVKIPKAIKMILSSDKYRIKVA